MVGQHPPIQVDEYDFDSSDEEDIRNTVGNIPIQWYDSLAHVGYDTSGRPIMRHNFNQGKGDSMDEFLKGTNTGFGEEGVEWRSVRDPVTGQLVILTEKDLNTVSKLATGKSVLAEGESGPYEPLVEWFSRDVMETPVTAHPPQKRTFIPSFLDRRRVGRMVHAIKSGWLKPTLPHWAIEDVTDEASLRRYAAYITSGNLSALDSDDEEDALGIPSSAFPSYVFPDVWSDQPESQMGQPSTAQSNLPILLQDYRPPRPRPYQRAAKESLPGHINSYNPPPEFMLSKDEQKRVMRAWRERVHDGHVSRIPPQMPQQFSCLRHVPFSERYLREREERVKDLVMATRIEKQRLATTPEQLLPTIPSLSQLRPYPKMAGLVYAGHQGRVTGISLSSCGQWLASISPADGCLRIWETATSYCFRVYQLMPAIEQSKSRQARPSKKAKKRRASKEARNATAVADSVEDNEADEIMEDDSDEEWCHERPTALVAWNPKQDLHLIAAAIGTHIYLINPALGDRLSVEHTNSWLNKCWSERNEESQPVGYESEENPEKRPRLEGVAQNSIAQWSICGTASSNTGSKMRPAICKTLERTRLLITASQPVCSIDWHSKGDYLLSLSKAIRSDDAQSKAGNRRLLLHRLSTVTSQSPFAASSQPMEWRLAAFHPTGKPQLFVASSRFIRIFDLVEQKELRRLRIDASADFLSSICMHPSGEHFVVGTFNGRFEWFDVELGNVPFKKLKLNYGAVRHVDVHKNRPLVSLAMDDGVLLILHATVTDDLLSKPVIIPVQLIRTGQPAGPLASVLATAFHPRQPHVYSGGADGSLRQFVAWN